MRNKLKLLAGFSLIEVMVAMLILGIGVLGYAAMQIRALEYTRTSYTRSQAMAVANDIAMSMRANVGEVNAYAAYDWGQAAPVSAPTACEANSCTSVQMVTYDAQRIEFVASQVMSGGNVDVSCAGTACTVVVNWIDWNDAVDGTKETLCLASDDVCRVSLRVQL